MLRWLLKSARTSTSVVSLFWKATFWAATSTVRVSAFWLPLKALTKSWLSSWQCTLLQSKPEFVKPEDVSAEVVEKEYRVQLDIAMQSGKPKEIAEKMVEGRMKKFTGEVSLTGQPFVMEPSKSVGQLLKEHNADVTGFIRFEVGEGIEKVETDFAAEVAAMSKQS